MPYVRRNSWKTWRKERMILNFSGRNHTVSSCIALSISACNSFADPPMMFSIRDFLILRSALARCPFIFWAIRSRCSSSDNSRQYLQQHFWQQSQLQQIGPQYFQLYNLIQAHFSCTMKPLSRRYMTTSPTKAIKKSARVTP